MDLLGQEEVEKGDKGKKIVLSLLILSVLMLIVLICLIMLVSQETGPRADSIVIDEVALQVTPELIITDENGKKYISIKDLSAKLENHIYSTGEYKKYIENKDKCYVESGNGIVGFEVGSNKIYKTEINSDIEYQYYEINSEIIKSNEKIYIDIEDIQKAFSILTKITTNQKSKKVEISIYTGIYLNKYYATELEKKAEKFAIVAQPDNYKAMMNGMIIASLNNKTGVLNDSLETKIGMRYNSMKYDEYTQSFIISVENSKFGVLDSEGKIKIEPEYDSIRVINYSPVLYEVKLNNKYGILKENGEILVKIEYDRLGCEGDASKNTKSVLVIPEIKNGQDGIVVSKDKKYGIINTITGKEIAPCELDKIYSKISQATDETQYLIELQGNTAELSKYIEYLNTLVVNR